VGVPDESYRTGKFVPRVLVGLMITAFQDTRRTKGGEQATQNCSMRVSQIRETSGVCFRDEVQELDAIIIVLLQPAFSRSQISMRDLGESL